MQEQKTEADLSVNFPDLSLSKRLIILSLYIKKRYCFVNLLQILFARMLKHVFDTLGVLEIEIPVEL